MHTRDLIAFSKDKNYVTIFNSLDGTVISSRSYTESVVSATKDARSLIISSMPTPMVYVWVGKRTPTSSPFKK